MNCMQVKKRCCLITLPKKNIDSDHKNCKIFRNPTLPDPTTSPPSSETQGQSVGSGEKARRKFSRMHHSQPHSIIVK